MSWVKLGAVPATERVGGVNLKGKTASQTDAYVAETNELLAVVKETLSLDPFDPKRPNRTKKRVEPPVAHSSVL